MTTVTRFWKRRFRGGPIDGEIRAVLGNQSEYVVLTPASLEDQLDASLRLIENGLVAVPSGRAVYRLNTTTNEFEYQEFT